MPRVSKPDHWGDALFDISGCASYILRSIYVYIYIFLFFKTSSRCFDVLLVIDATRRDAMRCFVLCRGVWFVSNRLENLLRACYVSANKI
mmetsp:Transcript_65857/g.134007  ORF Transcript_65857/g.134007 Transcript_65857/m.134007 type:complete len:90 (+) Transcript_65857:2507-2776(+)